MTDRDRAPQPETRDHPLKVRAAENLISTILRTGVFASMAVIAAGALLAMLRHPATILSAGGMPDLKSMPKTFPHTPLAIVQGVRLLHAQAFAALGLLLLILTPVTRVAASILIFFALRDRLYMLITSIVLALLIFSLIAGMRWS
jgi:uncharacterized membrane protein